MFSRTLLLGYSNSECKTTAFTSGKFTPFQHLDPFDLLDPHNPLLWWCGTNSSSNTSGFSEGSSFSEDPSASGKNKKTNWFIGRGSIVTLEFQGKNRFLDASLAWNRIVENSTQTGATDFGGLHAFFTFAFSDISTTASILTVPELLIGHKDGYFWATKVCAQDDSPITDEEIIASVDMLLRAPKQNAALINAVFSDQSDVKNTREENKSVVLKADSNARLSHQKLVNRALEAIDSGTMKKVVLARHVAGEAPPRFSLRKALKNLVEHYPKCWVFAVDGFFGASPETLIESHEGELHARVLAGTRPRPKEAGASIYQSRLATAETKGKVNILTDNAQATDLCSDPKEIAEHHFAVTSVVEILESCVGSVHTDGPFLLELPNVWHLATDVVASAKQADLLEIIALLHPTAAVAGVPREAALDTILALEMKDRGRYAGPVGWLNSRGEGEWAVGLRSAQIDPSHSCIEAWAGGGIVAGSDPSREYEETEAKLAPIRQALAE